MSGEVDHTVIICVRNGASTLRTQLDALASQVRAPAFELVVVDNGSTDATTTVFEDWAGGGTGAVDVARMVSADQMAGLSYARNVGAAAARGARLVFCDADDMVSPGWLAGAQKGFDRGAKAVTGRVDKLGAGDSPTKEVIIDRLAFIGPRWGADRVAGRFEYFWGCNFGLTADLYERIGGFDQSMPPYGCDDVDIGLRLAKAQVPIWYEPSMSVFYRQVAGARRRLRREFKDGIARACLVARHPDIFTDGLDQRRLVARVVRRALSPWARRGLTLRTRAVLSIEAAVNQAGKVHGTRTWVRSGRLGSPQYYRGRSESSA